MTGYEKPESRPGALRLHLNEHTGGCSPAVLKAIRRQTPTTLASYPDYDDLIADCARYLGIDREQFVLTNGLDEGILACVALAFRPAVNLDGPPEFVIPTPTFEICEIYARALGGRVIEVPAEASFAFPLEQVLTAVSARTRVVYVGHPNNPTGQLIPEREMRILVRSVPRDVVIFVDEAYYEFSQQTFLAGLERWPNVVIGRTFAKAFGIAGLRVGCVIAQPAMLEPIRALLPPYSVNVCAVDALRAALGDTEHLQWYLAEVKESKALLYRFCEKHGFVYWPSAGNFVLIRVGEEATRLVVALGNRGILIRDKSGDPDCQGCVRVTAGVTDHTRLAIDAMEAILCAGV